VQVLFHPRITGLNAADKDVEDNQFQYRDDHTETADDQKDEILTFFEQ